MTMGHRTPRAALALATATTLCACVPVYKTLQPYAEAQVRNEQGQPLESAEVVLISSAYPYGREQFRATAMTDPAGVATFYKVKDLRLEFFVIHGAQEFFWNWCVRGKGYATQTTALRNGDDFEANPTFVLKPGESTACPESGS